MVIFDVAGVLAEGVLTAHRPYAIILRVALYNGNFFEFGLIINIIDTNFLKTSRLGSQFYSFSDRLRMVRGYDTSFPPHLHGPTTCTPSRLF
ncbi:hypothetical protein EV356DRAFT_538362 [Viridothelium virens]|uniref:Uncharacterized protein n=1 Tax=Viridothelium virens TaxID=1048519 RepID=A0A6A6GRP7_VIRVR|nr:hypothetical protein EV356DRAFT_538362 [Viridothelium virens]